MIHKDYDSPFPAGRPISQDISWGVRLACCLLLFWLLPLPRAGAQRLQLEIEPEWRGHGLNPGSQIKGSHLEGLSVSRLDGLLSELALQRSDGTWMQSGQWQVFFSLERGRLSASADGLPAEKFKAIRFRVGLDPATDKSDPQTWPPSHALHPDVCGLHWGWSSGYVFLALEGHWEAAPGKGTGFSYHVGVGIGAFAPYLIGVMQDRGTLLQTAMFWSIIAGGICVITLLWLGPETRGKSL